MTSPSQPMAGLLRRAAPAPGVDRAEIEAVVQGIVATLRGDLSAAELTLFREVEGLSRLIRNAKAEIATLRPDEIREKHLPTATDELDAIVGATEAATHQILDSVERIEATASDLPVEQRQAIAASVTQIYEACNFQDITGQRISKVVRALKQIEAKVDGLVRAFGDGTTACRSAPADGPSPPPGEADLLNGPQLPGSASTQADIDALFAQ